MSSDAFFLGLFGIWAAWSLGEAAVDAYQRAHQVEPDEDDGEWADAVDARLAELEAKNGAGK